MYKDHLVIPRNSTLIISIFDEFHRDPVGGYSGEDRVYQCIASEVFWVGMGKDINGMVKQCEVSQRNKNLTGFIITTNTLAFKSLENHNELNRRITQIEWYEFYFSGVGSLE